MSALTFRNVTAGYAGRAVLQSVSASFAPGKVVGILGPNGAGKTTLLRAALDVLPHEGRIDILGRQSTALSRGARARAIAYLPQAADAHWPVTARHLVALGRMPHRAALSPLTSDDEKNIEDALIRSDAVQFASRRMDELSAGERARVLVCPRVGHQCAHSPGRRARRLSRSGAPVAFDGAAQGRSRARHGGRRHTA